MSGMDHTTSQFKPHTPIESLRISDCCTRPVTCPHDLGTIITSNLRMQNQVNNICRSSYLALHKIGQIRNVLDQQTAEKLVHACISCRHDFCNSLLYCIPDSRTSKLTQLYQPHRTLHSCSTLLLSTRSLALRLMVIVPSRVLHHRFGTLFHTISTLKMNSKHFLKLTRFNCCS